MAVVVVFVADCVDIAAVGVVGARLLALAVLAEESFLGNEIGQKVNAYRTVSYTSKSDREASDKQGNYKRVVPMRECTEHKRGYKAEMRLYKTKAGLDG